MCGDTQDVRLDLCFLEGRGRWQKPLLVPLSARSDTSGVDAAEIIACVSMMVQRFKHVVQCNLGELLRYATQAEGPFRRLRGPSGRTVPASDQL
jgi:hypothetical protein